MAATHSRSEDRIARIVAIAGLAIALAHVLLSGIGYLGDQRRLREDLRLIPLPTSAEWPVHVLGATGQRPAGNPLEIGFPVRLRLFNAGERAVSIQRVVFQPSGECSGNAEFVYSGARTWSPDPLKGRSGESVPYSEITFPALVGSGEVLDFHVWLVLHILPEDACACVARTAGERAFVHLAEIATCLVDRPASPRETPEETTHVGVQVVIHVSTARSSLFVFELDWRPGAWMSVRDVS